MPNLKEYFAYVGEAVNESPSIKDVSSYPHSPAYYCRYWTVNEEDWEKSITYRKEKGQEHFIDLFKFEASKDIILFIHFHQSRFTSWFEISLFPVANLLFMVAERELNKPEVQRLFEVTSDEEKEAAIDDAVKAVLRKLFWALPSLILQATNRAIHDSIISYIKTNVEHMSSFHWKILGLPRNFEYLPNEILESLSNSIKPWDDWRQRFIGNIREIPEPQLSQLPERYKELSAAYRIAKKEHGQKKEKFLATSDRHTAEDWREQWKKEFVYYPDLYADCLMLICNDELIMPRQLAYQHLSFDWGYSPDHMRRIINNRKAILKDGEKKVAHPDAK